MTLQGQPEGAGKGGNSTNRVERKAKGDMTRRCEGVEEKATHTREQYRINKGGRCPQTGPVTFQKTPKKGVGVSEVFFRRGVGGG